MLGLDVSKENVTSTAKAGVNDYLAKPFRHDPLITKVSSRLNIESVSRERAIREKKPG